MMKKAVASVYYDLPRRFFNGRTFPCRNLVIELTYRCNLACRMCSIQNEIAVREKVKGDEELGKDEIIELLDRLPAGSNITFTGGEVFLKNGIEDIIPTAANRHRVTLATNGVLLARHSEMLLESGVRALGVSLDGPPEIHDHVRNRKGAFTDLQQGLEALLEARGRRHRRLPLLHINSVILPDNHVHLPEIARQVKGLGLASCTFQIFDPSLNRSGVALQDRINIHESPLGEIEEIDPSSLRESLDAALEEGKRHGVGISFSPALTAEEVVGYYQKVFDLDQWRCHLPWHTARISPYGDVYPCLNYSIGNVREMPLKRLWNHERYLGFRRLLKERGIFKACIGCCKMFPLRTQEKDT